MKKVLLIAGGGTLGSYTADELLRLGHSVDVVCLEDHVAVSDRIRYFKEPATLPLLRRLLEQNKYDGVVNFLHYPNADEYPAYHELLSQNTDHLVFLSSYRVYSGTDDPITEETPQLVDTLHNAAFFRSETYAFSKSMCERYLHDNPFPKNWTIVRPVISFSERRFDIVLTSGRTVIDAALAGKEIVLPLEAENLVAGLDWAGNSGKIIARLLLDSKTIGEAYTVSSAQNLTWGEVAGIYTDLLGAKFRWEKANYPADTWHWYYDRGYNRRIDNSKVLAATGLGPDDFGSIRYGIEIELKKAGAL